MTDYQIKFQQLLRELFQFDCADHKLTEGADEVYVNGDSLIPGARALEGLFKARMFAGVEV